MSPRTSEAALALAEHGLRLFRVHPPAGDGRRGDGKVPAVSDWPQNASTDRARVVEMFAQECNIGIATGHGFFVLDVDVKSKGGHVADGAPTLAALESQHGALPKTVEAVTGSGGRHLYFRVPDGVRTKSTAGKIGIGLDVRGDGGFVVAPPSEHANGERYCWREGHSPAGVPIADAPAWLLDLVRADREPVASPHASDTQVFGPATPEVIAAAEAHLRAYRAKNPTGPGNGHADCCSASMILVEAWALRPDEAMPLLKDHNAQTFNPREQDELQRVFGDARKKAQSSTSLGAARKRSESERVVARHFNAPESGTKGLPYRQRIEITTNEADVIDKSIVALAMNDGDIFQRADALVIVTAALASAPGQKTRIAAGTPRVVTLRSEGIRDHLTRYVDLQRFGRSEHPPGWLPAGLLSRGTWPGIRPLASVLSAL